MLRFTSIAVAVVLSLIAAARAETKVLFIGNSFTMGGTASVPVIFDRLAQASGIEDPTTFMRGVGGTDFQFHNSDATSINTINSQLWDFVVLQNFSIEPTHFVDGSHSIADHFTYGEALYDRQIGSRNFREGLEGVLERGDPIVIDLSPVVRGYRADITRTFPVSGRRASLSTVAGTMYSGRTRLHHLRRSSASGPA